jgi:hypothetical protein
VEDAGPGRAKTLSDVHGVARRGVNNKLARNTPLGADFLRLRSLFENPNVAT